MGERTSNLLLAEVQSLRDRIRPGLRIGRFTIGEVVGYGGSGLVHRAQADGEAKPVAIKFLVNPPGKSPIEISQLFTLQAAILTEIRHSSIVPIQEFGIHEDTCYLIMDLFLGPEGEPLNVKEYVEWSDGFMDLRELRDLYRILLSAFIVIHDHQVVHGNLKPQNVLLQCVGVERAAGAWEATVAITDFGLARIVGPDFVMLSVRKSLRHVSQRIGLGKPALPADVRSVLQSYTYFSPEQRRGEGASRGSDIFSLGLMFYELLCGTTGMTLDPPSRLRPGVSSAWDEFILRAIEPDRLRRYKDMREMLAALERLPV
jgi:serine/threonine-protein kinase